MAIERPTFSESWYRVAAQKPRLRSTVQSYRQQYRGQLWHVLRDPSNNQFFRLNDAAYHFIGLLDGRRTVEEVWNACNEDLGDQSPTQNEAIQLLGQLYTSNLLRGEMPSDAEGMFERYRKRVTREVRGYMMNLLFIRIPLFDPDHVLTRWVKVFGWMFSWFGFLLWAILIGIGLFHVVGRAGELVNQVNHVLAPENLIFLYLSFGGIKAIHEFGHGFACKKYGLRNGSGGEVHTMGIMFLVFMPVPYVDASSAWALRSKWQRIAISAGGMYVELAVAAVAAIVWSNTGEGTAVHTICYNLMFIASVSSLLFNGNPLLRFDGYYILSDLLEIPNLSQRSKDYLYYFVRRYVYGVTRARTTANRAGEKRWLAAYGITSSIYRVFISVRILMFVADKLFFVGAAMAILAIVTWVVTPLGKWVKYLSTSAELSRVRPRAILATAIFFAAVILGVGAIPVAEYVRASGFVEPEELANVHAGAPGFVEGYLVSGSEVDPEGKPLVSTGNIDLETELQVQNLEHVVLQRQLSMARTSRYYEVQVIESQLDASQEAIDELQRRVDRLTVVAPIHGVWVAPDIDRMAGAFVRPGDLIGRVARRDSPIIRILADQRVGPRLWDARTLIESADVEIRVRGQAAKLFTGTVTNFVPAGSNRLPTASMGYFAGGALAVDPSDPEGTQTLEHFFEFWIEPEEGQRALLLPGQRVEARFYLGHRPLVFQWWQAIRQLVQRRFGV